MTRLSPTSMQDFDAGSSLNGGNSLLSRRASVLARLGSTVRRAEFHDALIRRPRLLGMASRFWLAFTGPRLQKGQAPRYKNVAADVSRLKLSSLAQLFECAAEINDPAHAGCYKNVAADVSQLKLPNLAQLFECAAEINDPAHAGCYDLARIRKAGES